MRSSERWSNNLSPATEGVCGDPACRYLRIVAMIDPGAGPNYRPLAGCRRDKTMTFRRVGQMKVGIGGAL